MMDKEELLLLTDEELLIRKKKLKKSKTNHAFMIGFVVGILLFGVVSWFLSSDKGMGFFIAMLLPVFFIYRSIKNSKQNKNLEEVLKERKLD